MTRKDLLEILCLLSAIESWGFSSKQMFPDYLLDDLCRIVNHLKDELLKGTE